MSGGRRNNAKGKPRTRTSVIYCEEKLACSVECQKADIFCEDCNSNQCSLCEKHLHRTDGYIHHDRLDIALPDPNILCNENCKERNFADLSCKKCPNKRFCFSCFDIHSKNDPKRGHIKIAFKPIDLNNSPPVLKDDCIIEREMAATIDEGNDSDELYFNGVEDVGQPMLETTKKKGSKKKKNQTTKSSNDVESNQDSLSNLDCEEHEDIYRKVRCHLLVDQDENLKITDEKSFLSRLGCEENAKVKVISIFGNTGDGKSHTLNHTFFQGKNVFPTSSNQELGTAGIWIAFDPLHSIILIDTEGLLGVSKNQNQRTRLLLKVLAVSDIVIYRTRAERLHSDMFTFLGDASNAYRQHFTQELQAASKRGQINIPLNSLGPSVIIFHETTHTEILNKDSPKESAEQYLQKQFADMNLSTDAFSSVQYVGTRTSVPPTNFRNLLLAVKMCLKNTTVRAPRKPHVVYHALKVLNEKFNGEIERTMPYTFPDEYFTCRAKCISCNSRCQNTMNHENTTPDHTNNQRCKYQHQYDNRVYLCKICYDNGEERLVVPKTCKSSDSALFGLVKYAWSGYVLECPQHGIIYQSRQHWYGNEEPEKGQVSTEVRHVWPGSNPILQGTHNAARKLLDGVHYASDTIASLSARPAKAVGNWVTDQIAPPYWIPNSEITHCKLCKSCFNEHLPIHHCRSCGYGFCDDCSLKKKPVPERGWGVQPVRVCDECYSQDYAEYSSVDPKQVQARKVGEVLSSTYGVVKSAAHIPLEYLKESARPAYWVPNDQIHNCKLCKQEFGPKLALHHCRACGEGVCNDCSPKLHPVPMRGWDQPVRVCNKCLKNLMTT